MSRMEQATVETSDETRYGGHHAPLTKARLGLVLGALLLAACSGGDMATDGGTSDLEAPADGGIDADGDSSVVCTCDEESTCCDGCLPRTGWCHYDGGVYGQCQPTGQCGLAGVTPVTCIPPDPCHVVDLTALPTCAIVAGNEGGVCSDGDPATHRDRCSAGECAGELCPQDPCMARTWDGSICVGTPQPGEDCDDGNVTTHTDVCGADGVCRGTACECTSGPCCDGCFLRDAGHVCDPMRFVNAECQDFTGCGGGGSIVRRHYRQATCTGVSDACDGPFNNVYTSVPESCSSMGNSCSGTTPMCRPCS